MINDTGVISLGDQAVAQVQIVENGNKEKRAQLYNATGVFLCEMPFEGGNETGYEIGKAMYVGYMSGQNNTTVSISRRITKALYEKDDTSI